MRNLTTLIDDNGTFIDVSIDTNNYLKDQLPLNIVAAEDAIYIGLFKPFYKLFIHLQNSTSATTNLTAEISNGAGFSSLAVTDDSKGLSRSGFITWGKDVFDTWMEQDVNGETLYWVRLTFATDFTADVDGVNLLFADDDDLRAVQRDIDRYLFSGDSSFLAYHVSARDEIIQSLRNSGYRTQKLDAAPNDLTQWDLLDPSQIRTAAKYLALANIMFDISANEDDKYYQKWRDYKGMFGESFRLFLLWLDSDDDGELDTTEQRFYRTIQLNKV